jgi:hypothetical protein
LYASPNNVRVIKSRRMRRARYVARITETRNALVGKPGGKRPLGIPRCRWKCNIRIDLREMGWEGVDWIHVYQDNDQWQALVNTVMNLRVP